MLEWVSPDSKLLNNSERFPMRICSFLPSATEILYQLGLQDQLHGVTHECDFPPAAKDKPNVVHSVFDGLEPTSGEISKVISERLEQGLGIYDIDLKVLEAAEPDLLLTQSICEV
jgi:iron complex transport system substrate-binding protein